MARRSDLHRLDDGVAGWNAWRHAEPDRCPSLVGVNLAQRDLTGLNVEGVDLTEAKLTGACLRRANLRDTKLEGARLQGANLQGADLRGARLWGARLQHASVVGADLEEANLSYTDMEHADFTRANLRGTSLDGAHWLGTNFWGAHFEDGNREGHPLMPATLTIPIAFHCAQAWDADEEASLLLAATEFLKSHGFGDIEEASVAFLGLPASTPVKRLVATASQALETAHAQLVSASRAEPSDSHDTVGTSPASVLLRAVRNSPEGVLRMGDVLLVSEGEEPERRVTPLLLNLEETIELDARPELLASAEATLAYQKGLRARAPRAARHWGERLSVSRTALRLIGGLLGILGLLASLHAIVELPSAARAALPMTLALLGLYAGLGRSLAGGIDAKQRELWTPLAVLGVTTLSVSLACGALMGVASTSNAYLTMALGTALMCLMAGSGQYRLPASFILQRAPWPRALPLASKPPNRTEPTLRNKTQRSMAYVLASVLGFGGPALSILVIPFLVPHSGLRLDPGALEPKHVLLGGTAADAHSLSLMLAVPLAVIVCLWTPASRALGLRTGSFLLALCAMQALALLAHAGPGYLARSSDLVVCLVALLVCGLFVLRELTVLTLASWKWRTLRALAVALMAYLTLFTPLLMLFPKTG